MEEEGCTGTVRREIVADKESEGEEEGPPRREERRKKINRKVLERGQSEGRQTKRDRQPVHSPPCSL